MSPAPKKPPPKRKKSKDSPGSMALQEGQKRLLIGAAVLGGALLYRHFHTGAAKTVTPSNSSATGTIAPFVPQSPILVPPGESIYDPNSQALLNTPFAPPLDTGGAPASVVPIAPAQPAPPPVTSPTPLATKRTASKPTKRKVTHPRAMLPKRAAAPKTATPGKAATRKTTKPPKPRKYKKGTVISG